MNRLLIGGLVAALALSTACGDPSRDARDDAQVLTVVLDHFARRDDTMLMGQGDLLLIRADAPAIDEHSADATYVVRRGQDGWRVACSDVEIHL